MKTNLFSQKFSVLVTLTGFFHAHTVAGVQSDSKDDPPVVVVPPTK